MVCPLGKICFEITHCFKNKYTKYSKFAIVENIIAEFKNITDPKFFFKNLYVKFISGLRHDKGKQ